MCDVATASLVLTAASGVMQYQGTIAQGKAQSNALRYEADVNKNNAVIQERLSADAIERGREEERLHRIKIGQLSAKQQNALALNGVEANSGTALDILGDTAQIGELEALTIRSNAAREAYGYDLNANNYTNSANNNLTAARNVRSSSRFSAMTTALSTAGSVGGDWYKYKQMGAFSTSANSGGLYGGGYTDTKTAGRINWY